MKKYAVVVAGGSGSRMQAEIPKQFLLLKDKPILMHTLERFIEADDAIQLVLVLPGNQVPYWFSLVKQYQFSIAHRVVQGGASRFQSVKRGLEHVPYNSVVAIHDGVRPFCPPHIINDSFLEAKEHGSAIVTVASKDSLRKVEGEKSQAVDRSAYRIGQTPQTFDSSRIKKAFEVEESPLFTDDASVFEQAGQHIHLIDGDYRNIKITTPEDLPIAETILQSF